MEHPPGLALLKILARGRQWESEVSILWCYLRQNTCKSDQSQVFFAGVGKIFSERASLCRLGPRAHPGIIRAKPGIVKNFLVAIVHTFLSRKSPAPIIVQ